MASMTARCLIALSALAFAAVTARVCTPIEIVARSGTYRASPIALVLMTDGGRTGPGIVPDGCCAESGETMASMVTRSGRYMGNLQEALGITTPQSRSRRCVLLLG